MSIDSNKNNSKKNFVEDVHVSLNPEAPNFDDLLSSLASGKHNNNFSSSSSTTKTTTTTNYTSPTTPFRQQRLQQQTAFFSMLVNDCCKNLGQWMQIQTQKKHLDDVFSTKNLVEKVLMMKKQKQLVSSSSASAIDDDTSSILQVDEDEEAEADNQFGDDEEEQNDQRKATNGNDDDEQQLIDKVYTIVADLALSSVPIARAMSVILTCLEQSYHWPVIPRSFPTNKNLANIKFIVLHALFPELKRRIPHVSFYYFSNDNFHNSIADIFAQLSIKSAEHIFESLERLSSSNSGDDADGTHQQQPKEQQTQNEKEENTNITFFPEIESVEDAQFLVNLLFRNIRHDVFYQQASYNPNREIMEFGNLHEISRTNGMMREINEVFEDCGGVEALVDTLTMLEVKKTKMIDILASATKTEKRVNSTSSTITIIGDNDNASSNVDEKKDVLSKNDEKPIISSISLTPSEEDTILHFCKVMQQIIIKMNAIMVNTRWDLSVWAATFLRYCKPIAPGSLSATGVDTAAFHFIDALIINYAEVVEQQINNNNINQESSSSSSSGKESLIRLHEERAKYFTSDMRKFIHRLHSLSSSSSSDYSDASSSSSANIVFSLRSIIDQSNSQKLQNAFIAVCQQYHQLLEMHRKMSPGIVTALRSSGAIRKTSGGFTNQSSSSSAETETKNGTSDQKKDESASKTSTQKQKQKEEIEERLYSKRPPVTIAQIDTMMSADVNFALDESMETRFGGFSSNSENNNTNNAFSAEQQQQHVNKKIAPPALRATFEIVECTIPQIEKDQHQTASFENVLLQINFSEETEILCQEGDRLLLSLTGNPRDERVFTITKKVSPCQFQIAVKNTKSELTSVVCSKNTDQQQKQQQPTIFVRIAPAVKNHFSISSTNKKIENRNKQEGEDFLRVLVGQGNAACSMIEYAHHTLLHQKNNNNNNHSLLICCSRDWLSIPLKTKLYDIIHGQQEQQQSSTNIIKIVLVLSKPSQDDEETINNFFFSSSSSSDNSKQQLLHLHLGGRIDSFLLKPENKEKFFTLPSSSEQTNNNNNNENQQDLKIKGWVTGGADFGILLAKSLIASGIMSSTTTTTNNTSTSFAAASSTSTSKTPSSSPPPPHHQRCGPMDLQMFPREPSWKYDVYNYIPLPDSPSSLRRQITLRQLAMHNIVSAREGSAWLAVDGFVFDISCLLALHPGGLKQLVPCLGLDATKIFHLIHGRSSFVSSEATAMLRACLIGGLVEDETASFLSESTNKDEENCTDESSNDDNKNKNKDNKKKQSVALRFLESAISDWVTIQNTATNAGITYKWPSRDKFFGEEVSSSSTSVITQTPPTFLLTNGLHQFVLNIQDWAMKFMPFSESCNSKAITFTKLVKEGLIDRTILEEFCWSETSSSSCSSCSSSSCSVEIDDDYDQKQNQKQKQHLEKVIKIYENIAFLWNRIHNECFDRFKKFMCEDLSVEDENFGICACEDAFEEFIDSSSAIVVDVMENKDMW